MVGEAGKAARGPRGARRASPGPASISAIDIAMEAEVGDAAADSPARRVLIQQ